MRIRAFLCLLALLAFTLTTSAQVNTAELSGQVLDPSAAAVAGAKITLKNLATGATRTAESNSEGNYALVNLPPGRYEVTVEAKDFARISLPELILTIGQAAEYNPKLQVASSPGSTITVEGSTEVIETQRTGVAATVDSRRINNLPINGRNYINFTLTNSQAARDSAPSIGAAPTSGLNFGGQRARSNQVSVDGADAVDNSVNGVRATVSQEAVQEFQLIISNYNAEFGRATGGVVNIVTKSGGNEMHGNLFGFLRHKSIQARNPFSVDVDPVTGVQRAVKQGYTRVQAGATLGGPIKQDKTWYFLAYETTRRQESGFTNIGANNFDLQPFTFAGLPPGLLLTQAQGAFVTTLLGNANPLVQAAGRTYALLGGASSQVALNNDLTPTLATALGIPAAVQTALGTRLFPLPVGGAGPATPQPTPASYVGLNSLRGNYPISEGTSLWSARFDHHWNERNQSFLRANVTPSLVSGIQVNAQNQNFGQNAGTRTSLQQTRDLALVGSHTRLWTNNFISEGRIQFARRGLHYGFSEFPGGSNVAVNIVGVAFFGREPFSTVDRIERRWQWSGSHTWIKGKHTFKFGSDTNWVQLRSKKDQIFELNFGGLYNVSSVASTAILNGALAANPAIPAGTTLTSLGITTNPDYSPAQAYGFGLPTVFVQGIGRSDRPLDNTAYGFFVQDSWKLTSRLTLNYGVRYDYEQTPLFAAATPLNQAAEAAFGLVEGIPRDKNNFAPRFGLAWDPNGQGNWVVRLGYGLFYDHPLLAVAFNSVTAEGAQSSQLISAGGSPSRASLATLPNFGALNAASIFQGVLNAPASFGYLASQQRFDPKLTNSIFVNHNFVTQNLPIAILPFTLHVDDQFEYAYAQQGNFTVERKLGNDYRFGASYTYTHSVHLNRPRNITPTDAGRLIRNFRNAIAGGVPGVSNPLTFSTLTTANAPATGLCSVAAVGLPAQPPAGTAVPLGVLVGCPAAGPNAGLNGQFVGTPAFFNFFRNTGPNPSFGVLVNPANPTAGYASLVALGAAAGFPAGPTGVQVPWSDVVQQESSGNSMYHGMTLTLSKRFSKRFEFLSSWTWSHSIDDSTDLQTLLAPQNNLRPDLERSNSTFDQRHRWVVSGIMQSPWESKDGGVARLFGDWVIAPIWEMASGRPFTVLTGNDFNLDFGSNTDRPSHVSGAGPTAIPSFFLPQANVFSTPTVCPVDPTSSTAATTDTIFAGLPATVPRFLGCTGNMGRNAFNRPGFVQLDLRLSRKFNLTEKVNLDFIVDMFNLFNRFNVGDVSPLCNPLAQCRAGEPTAAIDPRQFQFALKINW